MTQKVSMKGIHLDVQQIKIQRCIFQEPNDEEEKFFRELEEAWKEIERKRNILAGFAESPKQAKEIAVIADEKTKKRIYYMTRHDIQDVDVREKMQTIPLKEFIEAHWNCKFRLNMCRCNLPGHNDKTASFKIYPESNSFYCFGCHKGGSLIDFIIHNNSCDIKGAIDYVKSL